MTYITYTTIYNTFCTKLLSCVQLCDPMNCSPTGSSVHWILQARILEWVAYPFSRGSSQPRNQTWVSCIAGRFFTSWATKEALWSYRASQFTVPSTFNFHHTCSYLYDVAEIFFSDWNEHRSDVETWVLIQPMPLITLCESWL